LNSCGYFGGRKDSFETDGVPLLAQMSIPSIVRNIGNDHIFIGSTAGPSILLNRVDKEIEGNEVQEVRTAIMWAEYDDKDEDLQMIHEC
jgi:cleavage and polyadenylation specificity factor subunit 1